MNALLQVGSAAQIESKELGAHGLYVVAWINEQFDEVILYKDKPDESAQHLGREPRQPAYRLRSFSLRDLMLATQAGQVLPASLLRGRPHKLQLRIPAKRGRVVGLFEQMQQPEVFSRLMHHESRPAALRLLSDSHAMSVKFVAEQFRRLLSCQINTSAAIQTDHHRCGKREGGEHDKKQGRPRRVSVDHPELAGRNVNAFDLLCLRTYVDAMKVEKPTAHGYSVYLSRFARHSVTALETGAVVAVADCNAALISEGQFRSHIKKLLRRDVMNVDQSDVSRRIYNKVMRGNARAGLNDAGERLVIDSTVADIHLVCSWDRNRIIGRPNLYTVFDAATSAIVAVHVTLWPPSAQQAMTALYLALSDKTAMLRGMGLEHWSHLMPQACLPAEVYADRGELLSQAGHRIGTDLAAIMKFAPPYRPQWKAVVERGFRLLNDLLIHWVPGSTKGRLRERGEPDCRLDAILTLNEFRKLVHIACIEWNKLGRPKQSLNAELMRSGIEPGPAAVFAWGLVNVHGSPRYLPPDEAVVKLLSSQEVTVTAKGITIDNSRYFAPWMNDAALWHSGVMTRPMKFFASPWVANEGYVFSQVDGILRNVYLNTDTSIDDEWSPEDVRDMVAAQLNYRGAHGLVHQNFSVAARLSSSDVIDTAKRLTADQVSAAGESKRRRLSNTLQNRQAELNGQAGKHMAPHRIWNASDPDQSTVGNQNYNFDEPV